MITTFQRRVVLVCDKKYARLKIDLAIGKMIAERARHGSRERVRLEVRRTLVYRVTTYERASFLLRNRIMYILCIILRNLWTEVTAHCVRLMDCSTWPTISPPLHTAAVKSMHSQHVRRQLPTENCYRFSCAGEKRNNARQNASCLYVCPTSIPGRWYETLLLRREASLWSHWILFLSHFVVSLFKLFLINSESLKGEAAKCEKKRVECDQKLASLSGSNISCECPSKRLHGRRRYSVVAHDSFLPPKQEPIQY